MKTFIIASSETKIIYDSMGGRINDNKQTQIVV